MRRVMLFLLVFILFVVALNIIALPIPYSAARAFDSPLLTPMRPTPTGWPYAPFSWQVTPEREPRTVERVRGWYVEMIPLR